MNRFVTVPTFQPDALAFFRAKTWIERKKPHHPEEGQCIWLKCRQGNTPVHKLVFENRPLLIISLLFSLSLLPDEEFIWSGSWTAPSLWHFWCSWGSPVVVLFSFCASRMASCYGHIYYIFITGHSQNGPWPQQNNFIGRSSCSHGPRSRLRAGERNSTCTAQHSTYRQVVTLGQEKKKRGNI